MKRKLRMGMVGGGPDAFIGDVHRKAACLDGGVELVAGCFSRTPEKSKQMADALYLDKGRCYDSVDAMIAGELALPEGRRIDFVSIVTPNDGHFPIAKAFLEAGFNVILDKPMTFDLKQAVALRKIVKKSGKVLALTHNYTGYPMVKLARDLVKQGKIGRVLKIIVQYPQGWLINPIERDGAKQAAWRTDPKRSGAAGCMGDIGTHAENLAEYITGLKITEICADLGTMVEGRQLDDDGNCLVHFEDGARGLLFASQVCVGELNALRINVHGTEGGLSWQQEEPNSLSVCGTDGTIHTYRRGTDAVGAISPAAARATRLPFGHPEAFYEAFANVYRNATDTIRAAIEGRTPTALELDFPNVEDGIRGMQFIETVVASKGLWVRFP
ncbi:MAG: Gfo/Idh/MocA family oxidoreductase [bacterium]|jgi:predicted dehydrogenase